MNEVQEKEIYIKITKNGPYIAYGIPDIKEEIIITDENGTCIEYAKGKVFEINTEAAVLCRCGESKNAPFCDGSHTANNFDGTETAKFEKVTENAITYHGAKYDLVDKEELCAFARFCDANGSIWELIYKEDENSADEALQEAHKCPSGRLVIFDKNGNPVESHYPKEISILEDSGLKISGPVWVKGGIKIQSENGRFYEERNRVTLCRCGKSKNKPFCDSTHRHIKFKAYK